MSYHVELNIGNGTSDTDSKINIKVTKIPAQPSQAPQTTQPILSVVETPLIKELSQVINENKSKNTISLVVDISDVEDIDINVDALLKILDKSINLTEVKIISHKPANESANKSLEVQPATDNKSS